MNKKTTISTLVGATLLAGLGLNYWLQKERQTTKIEHTLAEIQQENISYTKRCGWVDWGHARGDGPKDLVQRVLEKRSSDLSEEDEKQIEGYLTTHKRDKHKFFAVAYSQEMKKTVGGVMDITVGTRSVYLVRRNLSKKTLEGVAWRIFKEVSENFERLQSQPPYGWLPSTAASSYGLGDLNGDKISFYSALRGFSREDIEQKCGVLSKERSLAAFRRQHNNPHGQEEWKKIPQLITVPYIRRGQVLTVANHQTYRRVN